MLRLKRSCDLRGPASGQRADLPYSAVHVAPHTADQTVSTNSRQQAVNNPEAGTKGQTQQRCYGDYCQCVDWQLDDIQTMTPPLIQHQV